MKNNILYLYRSYNFTYQSPAIKPPSIGEPSLTNTSKPYTSSPSLYPCVTPQNNGTLRSQRSNENRALWATLTPNGPQHYISEPTYHQPLPVTATLTQQDDHYEVVDHQMKIHQHYTSNTNSLVNNRIPIKSFENSAFIDYDYEDPTKYTETFRTDDMDSGYQEPQDIIGSLPRSRSPRHFNSTSSSSASPIVQQHHTFQHHLPTIKTNPINSSPIRNYPPPYHQHQHQQSPQYQQLLHQQHLIHHSSLHHPPPPPHYHLSPHRTINSSTLNRKSNVSRKTNCDDGSSSGRFNM